jgi:hypothetical protein
MVCKSIQNVKNKKTKTKKQKKTKRDTGKSGKPASGSPSGETVVASGNVTSGTAGNRSDSIGVDDVVELVEVIDDDDDDACFFGLATPGIIIAGLNASPFAIFATLLFG